MSKYWFSNLLSWQQSIISAKFRRPHWKNILAFSLCFSSRNNERGTWKSHGNHWLISAETQVSIKRKTVWGHVLLATIMILHMYLGLMMRGTLFGCSICYLYNRAGCIGIDSVLLLISSNIKQSKQKVSFHEVWCQ